jgi:serine/threonine protein phosphatase 1
MSGFRREGGRDAMSYTYAIGDLHGCADLLEELLAALRPRLRTEDSVVFLGDYIDRGPDSRRVVDRLLRFRAEHANTVTLSGNHEEWMLEAWDDFTRSSWLLSMEGLSTVSSYSEKAARALEASLRAADRRLIAGNSRPAPLDYAPFLASLPAEHAAFFRSLRPWHEDAHGLYAHAGMRLDGPPERQEAHDFFWAEPEEMLARWPGPKTLVIGHRPTFKLDEAMRGRPILTERVIACDLGCWHTGALCAVRLPDRAVVMVP